MAFAAPSQYPASNSLFYLFAPAPGAKRAHRRDVTVYRMPTSRATPKDREDMPALCCCAFVDRHGRDAHLADASCLDDYLTGAVPGSQLCEQLCADLDDRIRLPMHSGAVYLGVEGAIPLVVLPVLGTAACHSMLRRGAAVPVPADARSHPAWRRRRRSLLFVSSLCTVIGGMYLAFTLRVAQHVGLAGGWSPPRAAAAFLSAATVRHPPPATELRRSEPWEGWARSGRRCTHVRAAARAAGEGGEGRRRGRRGRRGRRRRRRGGGR